MRPIPGTVTDPSTTRLLDAAYAASKKKSKKKLAEEERGIVMLLLDDYQEASAATAVYPRVYTEDQVRGMLLRAYVRGSGYTALQVDDVEGWVESDLDKDETPFNRLVYPVLGLVGEAGEIANKLKKVARDNQGAMDLDKADEIKAEGGDVLWYVSAIATELDVPLSAIAEENMAKLASRRERGVLGGSGDNR